MEDSCVALDLKKKLFEPGEFIEGEVVIKTRVPLFLDRIILKFTKEREIDLCKIQLNKTSKNEKFKDNATLYDKEFNLYTNLDPIDGLSSGCHRFPFKFSLNVSDNSSTEIKGIYFDYLVSIRNSYKLSCFVFNSQSAIPDFEIIRDVQVTDKLEIEKEFKISVELSSILCLYNRAYSIYFKLNKNFYFSGDQLRLNIEYDRLGKHIKSIDCSVYEILSVSIGDFDFIRTRFIVGGQASLVEKGHALELRIPSTTPSSVTEKDFNLKTVLFITIKMRKSPPIKIKKYLQVVKKRLELPQLDSLNVLDGEVFEEKVFFL